jgi:succinate-semialdehyde dehydrogenase / glutarate-semialdehyde dehydrogenase
VTVTTIDPATGEPLATYDETPLEEVEAILQRAHGAASERRLSSSTDRAQGLRRLAAALRAEHEELALLATCEMGKPLPEARAEVEKCAWCCEWFAEHGPAMLERSEIQTEAVRSFVAYVPLGVLFAIIPWNYPY